MGMSYHTFALLNIAYSHLPIFAYSARQHAATTTTDGGGGGGGSVCVGVGVGVVFGSSPVKIFISEL